MGRPIVAEESFAALYDRYYKAVYHTAVGILHSQAEAEDVSQETFTALWDTLRRGEEIHNPGGWLLQVCRNRSCNVIRSCRFLADAEALETLSSADCAKQAEGLLFVHQMLATLREDEREIVTLHVIAGLRLSEIARLLELPSSTVRWRYAAAKKQLRCVLREVP